MAYHFRNLVFEGGGVKGIAYVGALEILEEKSILTNIQRVGGTSAGAINAILLALGYSREEQLKILWSMDFNLFMDSAWGYAGDALRLIREFGWYKGDYFHDWIRDLIGQKLGRPEATFRDLKAANRPDLYIITTNLCTGFSELRSFEHSPDFKIADAVRMSMSIPFFFRAMRDSNLNVFVDGGVLNNYPVKLFDRLKYMEPEHHETHARTTDYYERVNEGSKIEDKNFSPYIFNRETLGFRLDSASEIGVYRDHKDPPRREIKDFVGYMRALAHTLIDGQEQQHLHSDDWQRTIYIDTLGVSTTQFDINDDLKRRLLESGKAGTKSYFTWYDNDSTLAVNKPSQTLKRNVS